MHRERAENQIRMPFAEPVVTTSLVTGISKSRLRRRKRFPGSETNYERIQKTNIWWIKRGRPAFHQALRYWTNSQSDVRREIGESTNHYSSSMDEASSTEDFKDALVEAKKQRLDPFEIVQRVKSFGIYLSNAKAKEAAIIDEYYEELMNLMTETFKLTPTRVETLTAFLRFQKVFSSIKQP